MSNLQVLATLSGSHLIREPTSSPVLTKCWNLKLILATNFGSLHKRTTNLVAKISATKFGFVPDWSWQAQDGKLTWQDINWYQLKSHDHKDTQAPLYIEGEFYLYVSSVKKALKLLEHTCRY